MEFLSCGGSNRFEIAKFRGHLHYSHHLEVMSQDNTQQPNLNLLRGYLASTPLEQLSLSPRSENALRRAGLNSALDVQKLIESNSLSDVYNIGPSAILEIENCMIALFGAKGIRLDFPLKEMRLGTVSESDTPAIPTALLGKLPIDILEELGPERVERLREAGFDTLEEIAELAQIVVHFFQRTDTSLERLINFQKSKLHERIDEGRLHPRARFHGESIASWLELEPIQPAEQIELLGLLTRANEPTTLTGELFALIAEHDIRDVKIFIKYFGGESTLESIGNEIGITRERVRQITVRVTTKLWSRINREPGLYLQTALILAKELGDELSLRAWESLLQKRRIIDSRRLKGDNDTFTILCALLRSAGRAKYPPSIEVDKGLAHILNSPTQFSLGLIKAIEATPKAAKRKVRRKISYVGGIHLAEASDIFNVTNRQAADILEHLGFRQVLPEWYTVASVSVTSKWPILKAGLAMMEACGPLEFSSFSDGLRRYVSRFYDVIAPPKVMRTHLLTLGFELEDDCVSWPETPTGYLADSDKVFVKVVEKYGRVVSFQEVVEVFQENGFSVASATSRVLPQSPIVEKVALGLYKLRGAQHSWEDVESAKNRQENVDHDPEVTYGTDGITRYRITVGSWSLNGVISVSANQQPLPDLGEGWDILVSDKAYGTARRDEYLIWGLGSAFNALGVQIGDRVELSFDAWEKPVIRITKI